MLLAAMACKVYIGNCACSCIWGFIGLSVRKIAIGIAPS